MEAATAGDLDAIEVLSQDSSSKPQSDTRTRPQFMFYKYLSTHLTLKNKK